jgi:hypothetical protein
LVTWLSGTFGLNGIPSSLYHFRPPFSPLYWMENLRSSLQPVTRIILG